MVQSNNLIKILKKKYDGQVLLICLLVIFVATIILIGVQNRNKSSSESSLNDRTSAEAATTLNVLLEDLSIYSVNNFEKFLKNKTEFVEDETNYDITELIQNVVQEINVGQKTQKKPTIPFDRGEYNSVLRPGEIYNDSRSNCNLNIEGNKYVLRIYPANDNTAYFINTGQSWSIPINNAFENDSTCSLKLWFEEKQSGAGFIVYKTYANYEQQNKLGFVEYKNYYSNEDSENYCFSSDVENKCENSNFYGMKLYKSDDVLTIPLSPSRNSVKEDGFVYQIDRITVKAINGRVGILYKMEDENGKDCSDGFKTLKFSLDVYCHGSFSGKDVLVPEWGWYEPLFDYTFYSGAGNIGIKPNN